MLVNIYSDGQGNVLSEENHIRLNFAVIYYKKNSDISI